jgi:hypothetical protein
MTRLLLSLLTVLLLMAVPLHAQSIYVSKGQTLQNAATTTGNGSIFDVSSYVVVAFQTTISVTATVTYEGSNDTTNWSSLTCYTLDSLTATSTSTATQIVRCNILGIPAVRARISSYGSGSVTVVANASTAPGFVRDSIVTSTVVHGGAPTTEPGAGTMTTGSTDLFGRVTTVSPSGSVGVVTFTVAFTSAPRCVVNNETANGRGRVATTATTGFGWAGFTAGDVFDYICQGGN